MFAKEPKVLYIQIQKSSKTALRRLLIKVREIGLFLPSKLALFQEVFNYGAIFIVLSFFSVKELFRCNRRVAICQDHY